MVEIARARHSMPFGAEIVDGGVRFRLWAPAAGRVLLRVAGRDPLSMSRLADGFFECTAENARAGDRYTFSFGDEPLEVPDPAARFNPGGVPGPSEVIDPLAFEWHDGDWAGRPWPEAVIYEVHVGTFTPEGTYAAAEQRLDYLAELGINTIELMPLAETPGRRNWGYDGVLPFAPEQAYGRPEDLKRFIASAHARGLMVFLDVVYNHFGPEGNFLPLYAPGFFTDRHATPWGSAINYDGADSGPVRRFFIDNALYWLEEYRFDGLRLDAVHAILDDSEPSFLAELAAEVERLPSARPKHLVLENGNNAARLLMNADERKARRGEHAPPPPPRSAGYSAQWNDDFHHAMHVLLTGEGSGYYEDYDRATEQLLRCLTEGFAYQGEPSRHWGGRARGEDSKHLPPEAFVNFLQNHDQIGNRAYGERLSMLVEEEPLAAAETLLLLLPTPILLFMGEEFHAPNPFPFFCDFAGELGPAVTDGRRREFAAFFDDAKDLVTIPDPNDPATADLAKLDWSAQAAGACGRALARYRRLLARRAELLGRRLPARAESGRLLGATALTAEWRLADESSLALVANLGAAAQGIAGWPDGEIVHATPELRPPLPDAVPAWCVGWWHGA
ncbi:MAG TPA: malto-oligosyltrehalose trehalohydrolase [Gammaproteobacteria bacterium]|nr:malto-oligosyltrehalose trehalohydrolase [Gammaproteobacteria bacterium]